MISLGALRTVARRLPTIAPGRSPKSVGLVLAERTGDYRPPGSDLESWVLHLLTAAGLPPPVQQHRIVVGNHVYFVDLAYPERMIAIEVDGYAFHSDRTSFDTDRTRQNDLVQAGWVVLRFTSRSKPNEQR